MGGMSEDSRQHVKPGQRPKLPGKPLRAAKKAAVGKRAAKPKRSIVEILDEMKKLDWDFEAMQRH